MSSLPALGGGRPLCYATFSVSGALVSYDKGTSILLPLLVSKTYGLKFHADESE